MCQGYGDVPLIGTQRRFGECPVDDVTLCVAAADLPDVETSLQQQIHRLLVIAAVKRKEGFDHRDTYRAVEVGRLDIAAGRIAHRAQPPFHQCLLAGSKLGHRGVYVGENETFPIGVAIPQRRHFLPTVANLAAEDVETPQQSRCVGQAVAEPTLGLAKRTVVERQRCFVLPKLDAEQRLVPPGTMLAFHAFGLEEAGDYARAEEESREAAELEPLSFWPHHTVAHVMEMTGRPEDGLGWMAAREPLWSTPSHTNQVHI